MSDKKCPNCGACKECGARPPVVVYPNWWPPQPYAPYRQPVQWISPFTYTSGSGQGGISSGGTSFSSVH